MTTMPVHINDRVPMPVHPTSRPAGRGGVGVSVEDILRILRQRIFLILFMWLLVSGLAVGGTKLWLMKAPSYRATGAVLVESPFLQNPMELREPATGVDVMDRFVATQKQHMTNEVILRSVLDAQAVRDTGWFRSFGEAAGTDALEDLQEDLEVGQAPGTDYLMVTFATRDKKDAPIIVNTLMEKYLATVREGGTGDLRSQMAEYKSEQERLESQLTQVREHQVKFMTEKVAAPGATEGLNIIGERWRALNEQVTRLETEKLVAKAQYDNLTQAGPDQIAISPEMRLLIQQDVHVAGLQNQKMLLDQELMILLRQVGKNHRSVREIESQIEVVDSKLLEVTAEREREVRDYQVDSARTFYQNATQAELQLQEAATEAEARQRDLDGQLAQYRDLEDKEALLLDQFNRVRDFVHQLEMVLADPTEAIRVKPGWNAQEPLRRHMPRWELNVPIGSVLGLLLGIGLAILLDVVDTSIKTSRDVVRYAHIPILGTVPDLDDEEVPIDTIELAAHSAPRSMIAEAFRSIRTNLLLSSPAERQRAVLVTSPKPGEGRTAVAVNLAISIGQSGRRVLLVDANFHRPRLHALFPHAKRDGLSNALIGQVRLEDLVTRTDLPNLDVLTTGPIPPNPAELLASSFLRDLIQQASGRYDQIIFDGPPALLVSDVLAMTGSVDGVILVCRAKTTSRGVLLRAREQIEYVNGRIFGAVLNAAQVARGGYFREQIRSFYDYQAEEALATAPAPRALLGVQGEKGEKGVKGEKEEDEDISLDDIKLDEDYDKQ